MRKRLLESPPTGAKDQKWRQAVQELRKEEESLLKRCLEDETKGEWEGGG